MLDELLVHFLCRVSDTPLKEVKDMAEVEIWLRYDVENGKLLEVQENGRVVVDREQGAQLMGVAEAVALLCRAGKLRWEDAPYPDAHRRVAATCREKMVQLFAAIFGGPVKPKRAGLVEEVRLGREEV